MRYALIMAGGSGTRLWPMSRADRPKQLIPFIGGKSLLQAAAERLEGLIPADRVFVGAAERQREAILRAVPGLAADQFLGEPVGRDTLNAIGLGAAVIARRDPEAVIAVLTADHIIEPRDKFHEIVNRGFELAESRLETLVTFGVTPTGPSTAYGYLELAEKIDERQAGGPSPQGASVVRQFREKPDAPTAQRFYDAGPERYLWNSGTFVWRATTLLDCISRYHPAGFAGLQSIAAAWDTPERQSLLAAIFPTLPKISIDYAVMEPASRDPLVRVAALPMELNWLDIGSWPAFAQTCSEDASGNRIAAAKTLLLSTSRTLVASSDPQHLIATIGCEDLIIVHTPDATLVLRADQAEAIKELHKRVGEQFGRDLL